MTIARATTVRIVAALGVATLALCAASTAAAVRAGCSNDSNGQVACTIKTGLPGITAVDHGTGLDHASGFQDVDVISLPRTCHLVRLYYLFAIQGDSHVLPPVSVPVRQVAVTDSGPWTIRSPSWLTQKVRTLLRSQGLPGQTPSMYSLPYPTSYWYVYVAHTEAEALSRGGVHCVR